jgi:CheY-like chemotaxis protein
MPANFVAVIVDDNLAIRYSLKQLLLHFSKQQKQNLSVFTSNNGVEGIGYAYVANPNLIIVDLTLPKYSGREVIDFFVSNPRFANTPIIILAENDQTSRFADARFTVLNKRDNKFTHNLFNALYKLTNTIPPKNNIWQQLKVRLLNRTTHWANISDVLMSRLINGNWLTSLVSAIAWLGTQLIITLYLALAYLCLGHKQEANLVQQKQDAAALRVRTYPTLITGSVSLLFLVLQIGLFITGGLIIFNSRISSVFAVANAHPVWEFNAGTSGNYIYDSELIEFGNQGVRLRALAPVANSSSSSNSVSSETSSVSATSTTSTATSPQNVSTKSPAITVKSPIAYTQLNDIEVSGGIEPTPPQNVATIASLTYQLSPNGKDWYYAAKQADAWNWQRTELQAAGANTLSDINAALSKYNEVFGAGDLHLRIFLNTNHPEYTPILHSITVNRKLEIVSSIDNNLPVEPKLQPVTQVTNIDFTQLEPVIFNASFFKGDKIVKGKVLSKDINQTLNFSSVTTAQLAEYRVQIYFSNAKQATKDKLIGTANLYVNKRGELEFLLRTPSTPGGYVTAEVMRQRNGSFESLTDLAKPIENSTFTVDSTLDESDTTIDGLCASDVSNVCTFKAALAENAGGAGNDNIYFNIPTADSGYRDYDLPTTPNSGDNLGDDDFWLIESATNFTASNTVYIDGATQTLNQGDKNTFGPEIVLSGGQLQVTGNSSIVDSLVVHKGIELNTGANTATVSNNYVCTDTKGLAAAPAVADDSGIIINNVSGALVTGNVINSCPSIRIDNSTNIQILNNKIGVAPNGVSTVNSGYLGIAVLSSGGAGATNLVTIGSAGNRNIIASPGYNGIFVDTGVTNLTIQHNYIGVGADGETIFGMGFSGLEMAGGATISNNVIANYGNGIYFYNALTSSVITSNTIGATASHATTAYPSGAVGITIPGINATMVIGGVGAGNYIRAEQRGISLTVSASQTAINLTIAHNDISAPLGEAISAGGGFAAGTSLLIENNNLHHSVKGLVYAASYAANQHVPIANYSVKGNIFEANTIGAQIFGSSPLLVGNRFNSNSQWGVLAYYTTLVPAQQFARPQVGGQAAYANSVCGGVEKNCFYDNTLGGIYAVDVLPWNEDTLYADNNFSGGGNGATNTVAIQQAWYGIFEIFTGNQRRTDLANESITITFPDTAYVRKPDFSRALTATNYKIGCTDLTVFVTNPKYCDETTTDGPDNIPTGGQLGYSSFFAPSAGTHILMFNSWYQIAEYTIAGDGTRTEHATFKFDDPHIVSNTFTFDGNPANETGLSIGRGHPRTNLESATRAAQDTPISLGRHQNMEVELVDANPERDAEGNYTINVDTTTNETNVDNGTYLMDDGYGNWSGGSGNGTDGLANGKTSLKEAVTVARNFNQPVTIKFGNITNFAPAQPITLTSSITTPTVTIDGTGVTFDGSNQGANVNCIEIPGAYNLTIKGFNFVNCGKSAIEISNSFGITFTRLVAAAGTGVPFNLVGGTEGLGGSTANDAGDTDSGANNLQNYPIITSVRYMGGGQYEINGTLDGKVSEAPWSIELCSSNSGGSCTGYLANTTLASGSTWQILHTIDGDDGTQGRKFAAIATNSSGSSSEIGAVFDASVSNSNYQTIAYPITLTAPANNAALTSPNITLSWQANNDPDLANYRVYVNNQLVATVANNVTSYNLTGQSAGNYTWKVEGIRDNSSVGGTSGTNNFTVSFPINLTAPANNLETTDKTPTLSWQASTDNLVQTYRIVVNNTTQATVTANTLTYTFPVDLAVGSYTWQIVSLRSNNVQSSSSSARTFKVLATEPNIAFDALTPTGNITAVLPEFTWDAAPTSMGATRYVIYLDGTELITIADVNTLSYTPTTPLIAGEHTWYVVAQKLNNDNAYAEVARSNTLTFNLAAVSTSSSASTTSSTSSTTTSFTSGGINNGSTNSRPRLVIIPDVLELPVTPEEAAVVAPVVAATGTVLATSTVVVASSVAAASSAQSGTTSVGIVLGTILRRRRRAWGVVYDESESKPLPFASARLVDMQSGQTVMQDVTDLQGQYGFIVTKPGLYSLQILANGYQPYNKELKLAPGTVVMQDIGLVRIGDTKKINNARTAIKRSLHTLNNILMVLMVLGLVFTLIAFTGNPSNLNLAMLFIYVVLLLINGYVLWGNLQGYTSRVVDQHTKRPIGGAVIRVIDSERQLLMTLTNEKGEALLKVNPGKYKLLVSKQGYADEIIPDAVIGSGGFLESAINLHKLDSIEVSNNQLFNPFS